MSWRGGLEDQYMVKCKKCGNESVDPGKLPRQRYLRGLCPVCGHVHNTPGPPRGEFQARCIEAARKKAEQVCGSPASNSTTSVPTSCGPSTYPKG